MAAYGIFDIINVHDEEQMAKYREGVMATVAQYDGKYVVIGGTVEPVEGSPRPVFPVIIEFPSLAQARRWYESEAYRKLRALRLAATTSSAYFVAGIGEDA